ncbi:hypothetical protein T484DRAFT_3325336 [Baffinella frigidus]|nr:hypothetical protein T484DRAFT_3325336 [Cryptophyta sp. CCMP2293]
MLRRASIDVSETRREEIDSRKRLLPSVLRRASIDVSETRREEVGSRRRLLPLKLPSPSPSPLRSMAHFCSTSLKYLSHPSKPRARSSSDAFVEYTPPQGQAPRKSRGRSADPYVECSASDAERELALKRRELRELLQSPLQPHARFVGPASARVAAKTHAPPPRSHPDPRVIPDFSSSSDAHVKARKTPPGCATQERTIQLLTLKATGGVRPPSDLPFGGSFREPPSSVRQRPPCDPPFGNFCDSKAYDAPGIPANLLFRRVSRNRRGCPARPPRDSPRGGKRRRFRALSP